MSAHGSACKGQSSGSLLCLDERGWIPMRSLEQLRFDLQDGDVHLRGQRLQSLEGQRVDHRLCFGAKPFHFDRAGLGCDALGTDRAAGDIQLTVIHLDGLHSLGGAAGLAGHCAKQPPVKRGVQFFPADAGQRLNGYAAKGRDRDSRRLGWRLRPVIHLRPAAIQRCGQLLLRAHDFDGTFDCGF